MSSVFADTVRKTFAALLLALGVIGVARAEAMAPAPEVPAGAQVAVFAGGCFWCVESDFDKVPGVLSTTSGYTGGSNTDPTYENHPGHAESVEIVFDPQKVSYRQLVDHFWRTIDPTTKDRQFCDAGTAYRTAIFAQNPEQLKVAEASEAELDKTKPFKEPIVTQIVMGGAFYPAEVYHQDYYRKNPVRYNFYRLSCGRDARVKELWGSQAAAH